MLVFDGECLLVTEYPLDVSAPEFWNEIKEQQTKEAKSVNGLKWKDLVKALVYKETSSAVDRMNLTQRSLLTTIVLMANEYSCQSIYGPKEGIFNITYCYYTRLLY